ncbi:hypothetical protein DY000_02009331 [Brassica cretica]|uniref:Secreted protein n=1 Tax=Brassica cretica TaxID=69181 RepID=A0ABQ7C856_BRACR|nr:hypothetical protein DY000_02009331 [Brassica cretica]
MLFTIEFFLARAWTSASVSAAAGAGRTHLSLTLLFLLLLADSSVSLPICFRSKVWFPYGFFTAREVGVAVDVSATIVFSGKTGGFLISVLLVLCASSGGGSTLQRWLVHGPLRCWSGPTLIDLLLDEIPRVVATAVFYGWLLGVLVALRHLILSSDGHLSISTVAKQRGFSAQLWVLVLEVHKCRVMAAFLSGGAANSTCFAVRLELGFGFKRCVALCASPALALHYSGDDMGNSGIRDNKGNLTFPWCSSKVENGN